MYLLTSQMQTLPVISLQTGETVAWVRQPILGVGSLEILAIRCEGTSSKQPLILMARDVRQLATDCVIIDNEDELTDPNDIVRLKDMVETSYNPQGKTVISDTGRKLGHVEDYTINVDTGRVQKLHVRQSLLRAWLGATLIIDRTQIIDISPRQITVRDATIEASLPQTAPVPETPS